jgi:hypothetical protein
VQRVLAAGGRRQRRRRRVRALLHRPAK